MLTMEQLRALSEEELKSEFKSLTGTDCSATQEYISDVLTAMIERGFISPNFSFSKKVKTLR